ncbi:MAG: amino acid adenylation domain-containing protein [Chloroflexota bacterium]
MLLHNYLTASAQRTPEKEAICSPDASCTYQAVDDLSNQIAHTLIGLGVRPRDRVGMYLDKSIEAVATLFGILKVGATYVPLDAGAPVTRIAFIVQDCAMKALVTTDARFQALSRIQSSTSSDATEAPSLQGVILTDQNVSSADAQTTTDTIAWSEVVQRINSTPIIEDLTSEDLTTTPFTREDLAYMLYTSGSTGTPKGVMISHRAACNFVEWTDECFGIQASDRVSSHAPLHFDLSIFDIYTTIKAGATIILLAPSLSIFPLNLAKYIEAQRISVWYSVPSALIRLVLHGTLDQFSFKHLRHVLFAGEVFPPKYLHQLQTLVPHPEYHNLYGPTETNVCTYYQVAESDYTPDEPLTEPLPIGSACANHETFVVNEADEVVPFGEEGELLVKGDSLMSGYWGLPEKTSQVLIPDPRHHDSRHHDSRSMASTGLVYRTGDLVKERADGNYIFSGRRDHMIKSRGYRIELGEIESVLYTHPDIAEVAVLAVPDDQIGHALHAVVAVHTGKELTKGRLMSFCAKHLPKYMVPGQFEFRTSLPKTSTGKINRQALLG